MKGGIINKMFTTEGSKEKPQYKAILKLVDSKDNTGVNLCVEIQNHQNQARNKKFYILRVMHDGTIKVFGNNPDDIGLNVDDEGYTRVELKE